MRQGSQAWWKIPAYLARVNNRKCVGDARTGRREGTWPVPHQVPSAHHSSAFTGKGKVTRNETEKWNAIV